MNSYKNPPWFDNEMKPNERYTRKLNGWRIATDLESKKCCLPFALTKSDDPSGERGTKFTEIILADLR